MCDDIPRTGSSLSEIINEQQKANISCEESQTLLNYYVSTLQANLRSSSGASCNAVTLQDVRLQDNQPSNTGDTFLPLGDVTRRRPRYQTPLETIQEVTSSLASHPHSKKDLCTSHRALSPKAASAKTAVNEKKRFRTGKTNNLKNCVETIYQIPVWTHEDEHDIFGPDNVYNQQKLIVSQRPTNCSTETHQSHPRYKELLSKIVPIDGATQNNDENDIIFPCQINTDDDGAILIAPKLSLVDIHADQEYTRSKEDLTSLQATNGNDHRDILEQQIAFQKSNRDLSQTLRFADRVVDMSKHSRRQDADKHIAMVEKKQQVAKELFERLRSLENSSIQNIALNALMLLEMSMKRCALLRKSSTFEPEEVISSTTVMLNELTNIITVTGNQVRQVERLSTGDSDSLPILPLLTGPRSISSMFNSMETLMSPVRFSTSSLESGSTDNLLLTATQDTCPRLEVVPSTETRPNNITNTESELESIKLADLISFDDIKCTSSYISSTPSGITDKCSENLMDAPLEDLPSWQFAKISGKSKDDQEKSGTNELKKKEFPRKNNVHGDIKKFEDENIRRIKTSSENVPIKETKNNTPRVMEAERDMNDSKLCSKNVKVTQEKIEYALKENFAKLKVNQSNVVQDYYLSKESKENDSSSFVKEEHKLMHHQVDDNNKRNPNINQIAANKRHNRIFNATSSTIEHLTSNKQVYQTNQKVSKSNKSESGKNKYASATLKQKENNSLFSVETVKGPKTGTFIRDAKATNKTVEKNLSNICEKINVLKSCVAADNSSAQRSGNINHQKTRRKMNVKHLDTKSNMGGTQLTGRTQVIKDITKCKTHEETTKSKHSEILARTSNREKSEGRNKELGSVPNKTRVQLLPATSPKWTPTRPPTEGSSKTCRGSVPNKHDCAKEKTKREAESSKRSPNHSKDRKRSSIRDSKKARTYQKTFVAPSSQARNMNVYSCPRILGTPPVLETGGSKPRNTTRRSKRMLTHQEVQNWVNYARHQSSPKRGGRRRKQSASPPGRTKSERVVGRRRSKAARSPQPSANRSSPSETQLSDLGFVQSSPCIQQTTSQLILDALKGTVDLGIHTCLSRIAPNPATALSATASAARNIVHSLGGSEDEESSTPSSDINLTINQLVKSLDNTIESRSDKRVCWDSSIDIPPRSRSVPDETRTRLVETGSHVLQTLTHRLMGKLNKKRTRSGCLDDPETEVAMDSMRSQVKLSQSTSLNGSTAGVCDSGSTRSRQRIRRTLSRGSSASVHRENIDALVEMLQSTSDGCFETRLNARDVEVEASHAMAALEDLQALLSGLKGNISGQPRRRTRSSVRMLMTPLPLDPAEEHLESSVSEPEATIETRGEATIIITSRPPCKKNTPPPCALSAVTSTPSKSPFTRKQSKQNLGKHLLYGKFSGHKNVPRQPPLSESKWSQRNIEGTFPLHNLSRKTNSNTGSDSDSVRSRSEPTRNRLSQLAQPRKRYLESTKNMFENVLRKPYLERLNKKIGFANNSETRSSSTPSSVRCTIISARSPVRAGVATERDVVETDEERRDTEEDSDSDSSTCTGSTSSTSTTSSNTSEDVDTIHYLSPSEEDTDADTDPLAETPTAAVVNTIELGGIVYVGDLTVPGDSLPPVPTRETTSPVSVSECRPAQHQTHRDKYIKVDVDTWNIITQTCIENFQRREEAAANQIPPEEDGVLIAELKNQEDVLKSHTTETIPSVVVDECCSKFKPRTLSCFQESHNILPGLLSRNERTPLLPNLLSGPGINSGIQTLLNFDRRTEPAFGVAVVNNNDSGQGWVSEGACSSLDGVVLAMMDSFSEKVSQLREASGEHSVETASETDSLASAAWSQWEEFNGRRGGAWSQWEELRNSRGGKKYHPKRSIPDEISVCLEEKGDSKTLFDILREYLSSESESEPPGTAEVTPNRRPVFIQEVCRDYCGLYEIQSDDSEDDPLAIHPSLRCPPSVGVLEQLYCDVGVGIGSTVFMSYPVATEGARIVEITDDVVNTEACDALSSNTGNACNVLYSLVECNGNERTRISSTEEQKDHNSPCQSSSNIDQIQNVSGISQSVNEAEDLCGSCKLPLREEIGAKDVEVKMIFENLSDNKDEDNPENICDHSKYSTVSSSHSASEVGKEEKWGWSRGCVKLEGTLPCPSLACVSEVMLSSSDTPLCVTLPVMDVTTPETVRDLLSALTHTQEESCDLDTPPRSMETLLRQFSAVSLPGVREDSVERVVDPQDPYLESLALLPEPVYQGLYPASAMTGGSIAMPSPHDQGGRGDFVSRDVQTDEVLFPWPTLSREEIQHADHSSTTALETTHDSEEAGFLPQDTLYMGDAERRSISDLAIYTEVLAEYADPQKLVELKARLNAALAAERDWTDDDSPPARQRRRDINRVVAILSFICFVFTFITISILSIPHRCE